MSKPHSVLFEEAEDHSSNTSANSTIGEVLAERLSRRKLMAGMLSLTAASVVMTGSNATPANAGADVEAGDRFSFSEVGVKSDPWHHVPADYTADILVRWGDQVLEGAPPFTPNNLDGNAQAQQFGYNNDFIGFIPLNGRSDHGLLVVNHEYTNSELMFAVLDDVPRKTGTSPKITEDIVAVEMMAHGGSVLELRRNEGRWSVVHPSGYARRITAETEMLIGGPAAGHERMRTIADPTGKRVRGMLNNCGGGITPWGTWLTCEENFNGYFLGDAAADAITEDARALRRYGLPGEWYGWGKFHERFDLTKEPNEANRFGWVVEIDPSDPLSMPVKRTALGRFKHEGAGNVVNKDGRFVIYQGDDQRFEYVYRFVTARKVDLSTPASNKDLLDEGTLYVARFNADGTGDWLPLVFGQPNSSGQVWLSERFGFKDQGDVVINTRLAADLLGATKMDRPEDIEVSPKTGKVYVMLTNNVKRTREQTDAANPRAENKHGHIIELTPADGDHAAAGFTWEILIKCGDPSIAAVGATFNPATTESGWFGSPDNCAFDSEGRLWMATDGNSLAETGRSDGIWAIETEGVARGTSRCFFQAPVGAEVCGPCFTPDLETLFIAVQHPAQSGGAPNEPNSTFSNPIHRWPDFIDGVPPRPAVVAVTRRSGGKIAR